MIAIFISFVLYVLYLMLASYFRYEMLINRTIEINKCKDKRKRKILIFTFEKCLKDYRMKVIRHLSLVPLINIVLYLFLPWEDSFEPYFIFPMTFLQAVVFLLIAYLAFSVKVKIDSEKRLMETI
jgi:hypothetical protein